MANANNTPVSNKTPFRRLGLVRSIKKSATVSKTDIASTPTSTSVSPSECNAQYETVQTTDLHRMCPIKSASDSDDDCNDQIPVTPLSNKFHPKKTRLSLSQEWKKTIVHKKQLLNIKRRKLMDEVEKSTESETSENDYNTIPRTSDIQCLVDEGSPKTSSIKERIQEVKESISMWRACCIKALCDLQERRGTGDMESLLKMLQIPFDLVNYNPESQEFLNPD